MHLVILLISDAVRLNLPIVDAHQRTGADDIISSVQLEELQGSGAIGARLQFIEEKEGIARHKLKLGVEQGDVFQDGIHLEPVVENVPIFLLLHKIDFNDMLIVL